MMSESTMTESLVSVEEAINMSLDEYIKANGIPGKKCRKYKNQKQHSSINESSDIMIDQGYNRSLPNASSVQWRLFFPNRPPGMPPPISSSAPLKKYYNGSSTDSYVVGVSRNNQPFFKKKNRQNHNILSATQGNHLMNTSTDLVSVNRQQMLTYLSQLGTIGAQMVDNPTAYKEMAKVLLDKWDEGQQRRLNETKYDMLVQKEISDIQGKTLFFTSASGVSQSVISFDGPGVDNCDIKVHTTDLSMNQRFS